MMTLAEALGQVELKIGSSYEVQVDDKFVQLRVLSGRPETVDSESASEAMIEPWFELPLVPTRIVKPTPLILLSQSPIQISDDDLAQVTLLRSIFDFFAGEIARKSLCDGA